MRKTMLCTCILLFSFLTSSAFAGGRDCKTLLTGECVGCHEKEKYCDRLDKSERFWKAILGLMESNGADLTKDEKNSLISCLSNKDETVQAICK